MASNPDILKALSRLGLAESNQQLKLIPLQGGISSEIYLVELESRIVCAKRALPRLKSDPHWQVPVERTANEWEWLKIAEPILPVISPCPIGYDVSTNVLVMEYLDPKSYPNWKNLLRTGRVDCLFAEKTANTLADIHNLTANRDDIAQIFDNDHIFYSIRLEPYFLAAAQNVPEVRPQLNALVEKTLGVKSALVHGDVSPKNILVGLDGPIFIDAECAWYGEPAFDAAFCLTHFLLKCLWKPKWKSRYLECHKKFRESYLSNAQWIDRTELDKRVTHLHLGILLARVAGRSKVEYLADQTIKNLVKNFSTDLLLSNIATTCEVANLWEQLVDDK